MRRSKMLYHLTTFLMTGAYAKDVIDAAHEAQQILLYLELMGMQPPEYQDLVYGSTLDNFAVSEWEREDESLTEP